MAGGIAHQNKDIIFKILSENYKNKSLSVYGLKLPPIKEALPTNLPALKLDEKRADNIFMLENDTILILKYESSGGTKNLIKYGHYARVTEAYSNGKLYKVVIVVMYTGDIESAVDSLDLGCMQLKIHQVFLSAFDGDAMYAELAKKVRAKEPLTDGDVMRFIILPLTAKDDKQQLLEKTVNLAKEIKNEHEQTFIIAGILSATDKFIEKDYSNKLKEWLRMTKVAQLFEEEKIEAVAKAVAEAVAEAKEEAKKEAKEEAKKEAKRRTIETAKTLLDENVDISIIMKTTKLSKSAILKLKK